MREVLWILHIAAALGYLSAGALFIDLVRRHEPRAFSLRFSSLLLKAGMVFHLGYLVVDAIREKSCPILSLHSALGVVSLAGVAAYSLMARRRRMDALAILVSCAAVFFLVAAQLLGHGDGPDITPWLFAVHITCNLVGSGILIVAGGASVLYLLQSNRLKTRASLGRGPKLPALDALDTTLHTLLWVGVPVLTLGMLTGRLVARQITSLTGGDQVRAILAVISWLLLLAALGLRLALNFRGRRSAYLTAAGSLGVLVVVVLYILRALGVMR